MLSVSEALHAGSRQPVRVHGYVVDPWDDVARLCPERAKSSCYPHQGLIVEGVDPAAIDGVEEGCCSIGYWSKNEIVLEGRLERGRLVVIPRDVSDL